MATGAQLGAGWRRVASPQPLPTVTGRSATPSRDPYPSARCKLRLAPATGSKKAPARSPPRRSSPPVFRLRLLAPAGAAGGSEPVQREGRGGESSGEEVADLRDVARGVGTRAVCDPGLLLGQVESPLLFFPGIAAKACCLVHEFLPGARPGSLHRVESP